MANNRRIMDNKPNMEKQPQPFRYEAYINCWNCGRLVPKDLTFHQVYCSQECGCRYSPCPICGRYFLTTEKEEKTCSKTCLSVYNEFTEHVH